VPLVLAALPEHHPVFHAISQNPALLAAGVEGDPESMSVEQLRAAAWEAVEPQYLSRLAAVSETFTTALAHQKATSDLADAARAAVEGRVSQLLVEAEGVSPGRIDPATGALSDASIDDPQVGDALDDLAEAVLRTGGDVVVVPGERMPSTSGLAAILRY
jgi:stalled ribosome rescue protein Dom34